MSNRALILGGLLFVGAFALLGYLLLQSFEPQPLPLEPPPEVVAPPGEPQAERRAAPTLPLDQRVIEPPAGPPSVVEQGPVVQPPVVAEPPPTPQELRRRAAREEVAEPRFEVEAIEGERVVSEELVGEVVKALGPMLEQCVADNPRQRGPKEVVLRFEVRAREGRRLEITRPEVDATSVQDPFVTACLQDAPLDVDLRAGTDGRALVRAPFRINPSER